MEEQRLKKGTIMTLPIEAFGEIFPVSVGSVSLNNNTLYDISSLTLPERFVIHEVRWFLSSDGNGTVQTTIALGDVAPTSDATFDAMELLLPHYGLRINNRPNVLLQGGEFEFGFKCRLFRHATGRRLVGRFQETATIATRFMVTMLVSSVPRTVQR